MVVKFKDLSGWLKFWIVAGAISTCLVMLSFLYGFILGLANAY